LIRGTLDIKHRSSGGKSGRKDMLGFSKSLWQTRQSCYKASKHNLNGLRNHNSLQGSLDQYPIIYT
jgi:hypothetical protein